MTPYINATAVIVASYVAKNSITTGEIKSLIRTVHDGLAALGGPDAPPVAPQEPAVSIKKSITDDYLICLEDGAKMVSLKRYLRRFDLTPETYRKKWGLPADYPMVAPSYAKRRSELAKSMGLGRGGNRRRPD